MGERGGGGGGAARRRQRTVGGRRGVDESRGHIRSLLVRGRAGGGAQGPLGGRGQAHGPLGGAVQEVVLAVGGGRESDAKFGQRLHQVPVLGAGGAGRQGRGRKRDVRRRRPQRRGEGSLRLLRAVRALDGHGEALICQKREDKLRVSSSSLSALLARVAQEKKSCILKRLDSIHQLE